MKTAIALLAAASISLAAISTPSISITQARADGFNGCNGWQKDAYLSVYTYGEEDLHGWLGDCKDPATSDEYFYAGHDARFGWGGPTDYYLTHAYLHLRAWLCGGLVYDQTHERYSDDGYGTVPNPQTDYTGTYPYGSRGCALQADAYGIEEETGLFRFTWYKSY